MSLRKELIESAKRSHLAAQAYLTGIRNPAVVIYDTGGDEKFARQMALACMHNAKCARKMAAAVRS